MRSIARSVFGTIAAFALAMQVATPAFAAARTAACCCVSNDPHHQCPVCNRTRERACNVPLMKTCGSSQDSASPVPLLVFVPPLAAPDVPLTLPDPVATPPTGRPEPPVLEVPTPPPLA